MTKRPHTTISTPKIEHYDAQPYVAIAVRSPIRGMSTAARKAMVKVKAWCAKRGITPVGPLFWRYTVINMEGEMQLEIGYPVAAAVTADETVISGVLPAGNYVTTTHTGRYSGKRLFYATRDLLDWSAQNNIEWDRHDTPNGDAWASRLEWYITDPAAEPNPDNYETVLAFKVK